MIVLFAIAHPGVVTRGEVLFPGDILFDLAGWRHEAPAHFKGATNLILGDPVFQYYPWRVTAMEMIRNGEAPLWNRWNGLGMPLLANFQSSLFDPTSIGFLFLPPAHAWTLQFFLRFLIAGALTYLLALYLGAGVAGARLAAIAYAFGGTVGAMAHWPTSSGAAWLPGLVLVADHLALRPSARRVAFLGVLMALCITASHPETLLVIQATVFGWFLVRAGVLSRNLGLQNRLAHVGRYLVAGLVALLVTAPFVLPFVEYLPDTHRYQLLSRGDAGPVPCYPPRALISFLTPSFFGGPKDFWGKTDLVWMHCVYSGAVSLLLAVVAFARRETRGVAIIWLVLTILAIGISFTSPLNALVAQVPLLKTCALVHFRLTPNLGIALLGGLGLRALADVDLRTRLLVMVAAVAATVVAAAFVAWFWTRIANLNQVRGSLTAVGVLVGTGLLASIFAVTKWRFRSAVLVAIASAELLIAKIGYEPSLAAKLIYPETAWARAVHEDMDPENHGTERVVGLPEGKNPVSGVLENALAPYRLEDPGASDPMDFADYHWLVATSLGDAALFYVRPGLERPDLLDLMGVRYLLSPQADGTRSLARTMLKWGSRTTTDPSELGETAFEIDGRKRTVLFEHAPCVVETRLPPSRAPRSLSFSLGVNPASWRENGDGVTFVVEAAAESPPRLLLSKWIDPKHDPRDRCWIDERVDLSRFAGRRISLELRTSGGPTGDRCCDFAAWGDPRIGNARLDLASLASGLRRSSSEGWVDVTRVEIGAVSRPALSMCPDSDVQTVVDVPASPLDAVLDVSLALNPAAWFPDKGDGVLFEVIARPALEFRRVFERHLNPCSNETDRHWIDGKANLGGVGAGAIRLRLRAETGPAGDGSFDQGGWADLTLSPPLDVDLGAYDDVHVIRRETAFRRARIVYDWMADESIDVTRTRIRSGSTDLSRMAFIERPKRAPESGADELDGDDVIVRAYEAQHAIYEATARAHGFLVVFDSFAPGWEATVDGKPAKIRRADRCFRAVALEPGRHVVEFHYRPASFRIGLGLSAVGLLALLGISLIGRRRGSPVPVLRASLSEPAEAAR